MRIAVFAHSLLSDWNHGSAHFLRGVATELGRLGHPVRCYEAQDAWSARNLVTDAGPGALAETLEAYPGLHCVRYDADLLDLDQLLEGVDLCLVHQWNEPSLVRRLGQARSRAKGVRLLFHDTDHRAVTRESFAFDLSQYDGVLVSGQALEDVYRAQGLGQNVFVWHEAADVRLFHPQEQVEQDKDLVWVGNWGDDERTAELEEFLLGPSRVLGLSGTVYGVRYPAAARERLRGAGLSYAGYLPNYKVPDAFARARLTVHVPRRPGAKALRGIPTLRPFEALACGIPLVSAPWEDSEGLFREGLDYLRVPDGQAMQKALRLLLNEPSAARALAQSGLRTVLSFHTCAHRAQALLGLCRQQGWLEKAPLAQGVRA